MFFLCLTQTSACGIFFFLELEAISDKSKLTGGTAVNVWGKKSGRNKRLQFTINPRESASSREGKGLEQVA